MIGQSINLISAGAGTGKTHRMTEVVVDKIRQGLARPNRIIATTFTVKAAVELEERVRQGLLRAGLTEQSALFSGATVGTVHSVCASMLKRFWPRAGLSPEASLIPVARQKGLFQSFLSRALEPGAAERLTELHELFGVKERDPRTPWSGPVLEISSMARAYGLAPTALPAMANDAMDEFRQMLPHEPARPLADLEVDLRAAISTAEPALDSEPGMTKKTASYLKLCRNAHSLLKAGRRIAWSQWAGLAAGTVGAGSRMAARPIQALAAGFQTCPEFIAEYAERLNCYYGAAAGALEKYSAYKTARGLVDYGDLEEQARVLLDDQHVQASLCGEIDLLVVDEFQDTSPLQLDLFLRLSRLARESVWVGDPKQSIYGFRGADPELMESAATVFSTEKDEVLSTNRRSRPPLIDAFNSIFLPLFGNRFPRDRVALEASDDRLKAEPRFNDAPALELWELRKTPKSGPNKLENQSWTLAGLVQDYLSSSPIILDRLTGNHRPAEAGDLAILCRTNDRCRLYAAALRRIGVPASSADTGLCQRREVQFVLAALSFALDNGDSLAREELRYFLDSVHDLEGQLKKLSAGEVVPDLPLPVDPGMIRSTDIAGLLDRLLTGFGIPDRVARWGDGRQRTANLERLRDLARDYQQGCHTFEEAATGQGFRRYLGELAWDQGDLQGFDSGGQAVTVLTYHRAKGLEWPIVVLADLSTTKDYGLGSVEIVRRVATFDPAAPLAGVRVRFLPNPTTRETGLGYTEGFKKSAVYAAGNERSLDEQRRLFYVGATRARDYLCLVRTAKSKPFEGLNALGLNLSWPEEQAAGPHKLSVVIGESHECELPMTLRCRDLVAVRPEVDRPKTEELPLSAPRAVRERRTLLVRPSSADDQGAAVPRIVQTDTYAPTLAGVPEPDLESRADETASRYGALSPAVAGSLYHLLVSLGPEPHPVAVARIAAGVGMTIEGLEPILASIRSFWCYVLPLCPGAAVHAEYPLICRIDGRIIHGTTDLLLESKEKVVLIDHKTVKATTTEEVAVKAYGAQLLLYIQAAAQALQPPILRAGINLPLAGKIVWVSTRNDADRERKS